MRVSQEETDGLYTVNLKRVVVVLFLEKEHMVQRSNSQMLLNYCKISNKKTGLIVVKSHKSMIYRSSTIGMEAGTFYLTSCLFLSHWHIYIDLTFAICSSLTCYNNNNNNNNNNNDRIREYEACSLFQQPTPTSKQPTPNGLIPSF